MDNLETYLKEVQLFSKTQRKIFQENKTLLEQTQSSLKTLGEIRRQHETAVEQIRGKNYEFILTMHQTYKITDVDKMIGYFKSRVMVKIDDIKTDAALKQEYDKVLQFVLGRTVDQLLYTVTTNYYDIRYDAKIKGYDKFIRSFDCKLHENKILKIVFDKFIEQLEDELIDAKTSIPDILKIFVEDLDHIFDEPQNKKFYLVENFIDYVEETLLTTIYYKNFSNVANFILVIRKLQHFYFICTESKLVSNQRVMSVDKHTFQTFKSYANNYNDKFELLSVFDSNYEFINQYFSVHEQKSLKIWIIDLIESYLHMISENDKDKLLYGSLVFKFYSAKFSQFDKLLSSYFNKKLSDFIDEYYEKYFQPSELPEYPKVDKNTAKLSTIIDTYKKYFKKFRVHLDGVIEIVKNLRFKELEFKKYANEEAIKRYIEGYHKALTEFLEIDTGNVDKKKIFKMYANEVENRLKTELVVE